MSKLYCPYCNPKYQFHKKNINGELYCGLCGEYLVKKKLITFKALVSMIAIFSIMCPIFFLLFFSINNFWYQEKESYQTKMINFKN